MKRHKFSARYSSCFLSQNAHIWILLLCLTKIKQRKKENFEVFLFLSDFQPEIQIKVCQSGVALFLYMKVIQRKNQLPQNIQSWPLISWILFSFTGPENRGYFKSYCRERKQLRMTIEVQFKICMNIIHADTYYFS